MKPPASDRSADALPEGQRKALLSLLADDDPVVYSSVRTKLLSYGQSVREWLQPHRLSSDPLLRRRVLEIESILARQINDQRFLRFCLTQGDDLDLEEGVWGLAHTRYPEMNMAGYQALIDQYATTLRERLDYTDGAQTLLHCINEFLFDELGFHGNETDYYDPDNSYLNKVIDQRTGNPISLCTVYLLVCRRLRLPVAGVGMPGHFLCRFQTSTQELYIDAFNRGKLLTRADCIKYLVQTQPPLEEGLLSPVSSRRILVRMCANLHQIYLQQESAEEAARLQRYWVALAR